MGGQVNKDFCSLVRDFCISNDEYVGSRMPGLTDELDKLIGDVSRLITKEFDEKSLFEYALRFIVHPLAYSMPLTVLECMPYHLFYTARLIIESLMVGLYEDYWNRDWAFCEKLSDAADFRMGSLVNCNGSKCDRYVKLRQGINEALSWLKDELGMEPVDFIYEVYDALSKMMHPITRMKCGGTISGAFGIALTAFAYETPPMRVILQPAECKGDDKVLKAFYITITHTRLAINMLIYTWSSLMGKLSNEVLEDVRRRIKDAVKTMRQQMIEH